MLCSSYKYSTAPKKGCTCFPQNSSFKTVAADSLKPNLCKLFNRICDNFLTFILTAICRALTADDGVQEEVCRIIMLFTRET